MRQKNPKSIYKEEQDITILSTAGGSYKNHMHCNRKELLFDKFHATKCYVSKITKTRL